MATPEDLGDFLPEASPEINIVLGENTYTLNWHNTLLRKFLIGEGEYDHLLHQMPDGQSLFYFLNSEGGIELMEELEKHSFPTRTDPTLDDSTIEYYATDQAFNLEAEISREFS